LYHSNPKNPAEMVAVQISSRDIVDPRVLRVMRKIPREKFVPEKHRALAYSDQALPIGKDQTISQPYVVAFMTQALAVQASSKVLEVGTGSGYQTAILARLARTVYTVEIIPSLQERAKSVLDSLGFKNIFYKCGDGRLGWHEQAPFDRIIVTAASREIPKMLLDQLADNGKMIIPSGKQGWSQNLILISKHHNQLKREKLLPVRFVPLVKTGKGKQT